MKHYVKKILPLKKHSILEKISFFSSLSQLLNVGVSLKESIHIISSSSTGSFQKSVQTCLTALEEGRSLSGALTQAFALCDTLSLSFVCMGEATGKISQSLQLVHMHFQALQDFSHAWRKALFYPLIVCVVMSLMVYSLCVTLLPTLLQIISDEEINLSWSTRGLLFMSHFLSNHGLSLGFGMVGIALGAKGVWSFSLKGRILLEKIILICPYVGAFCLRIIWGRFFQLKGLMIQYDIGLLSAFDTASSAVFWRCLRPPLHLTRQHLVEGYSLYDAYKNLPGLDRYSLYFLKLAEKTGALERVFQHIGDAYRKTSQKHQERFLISLEPTCLIILGIFLLWIISATILPIYSKLNFEMS